MTLDILSALQNTNPEPGAKRCKLQKILDSIPGDTAGKADLEAAVYTRDAQKPDEYEFAAQRLTVTFGTLKMPVSKDIISEHRGKICACYR